MNKNPENAYNQVNRYLPERLSKMKRTNPIPMLQARLSLAYTKRAGQLIGTGTRMKEFGEFADAMHDGDDLDGPPLPDITNHVWMTIPEPEAPIQ